MNSRPAPSRFAALGFVCAASALLPLASHAAIVVPGADGSDGTLDAAGNVIINLSEAVTAPWNSPGNGKGVYDPSQWAVVLKYSSVNIASGATVTFINHASRAPVVFLVSGDFVCNGTLSLDAGPTVAPPQISEPGPGGFRGGSAYAGVGLTHGPGFGLGGGGLHPGGSHGFGGSFGSQGVNGPPTYGSASLIPLIGGSGGGGFAGAAAEYSGGAGGGAILIAAQTVITGIGTIRAIGGMSYQGGGGSGGGIRLVTDSLGGGLQLKATAGTSYYHLHNGGSGRIRLERVTDSSTADASSSPAPTLGILAAGATAVLWPPEDAPSVRIMSIGGASAPEDPRARFGVSGGDVTVPATATTRVVLRTVNVGQDWAVAVRATPLVNADFVTANAAVESVLAQTPLTLQWTADVPVSVGYSAFQAKVTRP